MFLRILSLVRNLYNRRVIDSRRIMKRTINMFIGEVAARSGATAKAIRHYEAIGLLLNVKRSGRYRIYTDNHVSQIQLIKCEPQYGFSLN